jgi:tetratricopeptide (TPR) repeat protein
MLGYALVKYSKDFNRLTPSFAWLAVVIPLSILPCYTQIDIEEPYAAEYLKKNPQFYIEGATALQNNFTYIDNMPKAEKWYTELPVLSEDFMDLTGAKESMYNNYNSVALEILFKLKTKYPFWDEPRYLISNVYSRSRQFDKARAELDTCLILKPYHYDNVLGDYRYYRDINNFITAIEKAKFALKYYRDDNTIRSDLVIYYYRANMFSQADSLSDVMIYEDKTLPYPNAIKGFLSEKDLKPIEAINHYNIFIEFAPDAPEAPYIQVRIDSLMAQLEK